MTFFEFVIGAIIACLVISYCLACYETYGTVVWPWDHDKYDDNLHE